MPKSLRFKKRKNESMERHVIIEFISCLFIQSYGFINNQ